MNVSLYDLCSLLTLAVPSLHVISTTAAMESGRRGRLDVKERRIDIAIIPRSTLHITCSVGWKDRNARDNHLPCFVGKDPLRDFESQLPCLP